MQAPLPPLPHRTGLPRAIRGGAAGDGAGRRGAADPGRRRTRHLRRSRFPERAHPCAAAGPRATRALARRHLRCHHQDRAPARTPRAASRAGRVRLPVHHQRGRVVERRRSLGAAQRAHRGRRADRAAPRPLGRHRSAPDAAPVHAVERAGRRGDAVRLRRAPRSDRADRSRPIHAPASHPSRVGDPRGRRAATLAGQARARSVRLELDAPRPAGRRALARLRRAGQR